jgi:hypothetical protein
LNRNRNHNRYHNLKQTREADKQSSSSFFLLGREIFLSLGHVNPSDSFLKNVLWESDVQNNH